MSRSISAGALAALALLCSVLLAGAQQLGTADQARAMMEAAVAALQDNEASALDKFNDKNSEQFHSRDLYVFCINMSDGTFTAQLNPDLVGTDVRALKLKDEPFGQRLYDALRGAPEGRIITVGYSTLRPGTKQLVQKVSYVARVGNHGCGVGYYR